MNKKLLSINIILVLAILTLCQIEAMHSTTVCGVSIHAFEFSKYNFSVWIFQIVYWFVSILTACCWAFIIHNASEFEWKY